MDGIAMNSRCFGILDIVKGMLIHVNYSLSPFLISNIKHFLHFAFPILARIEN